MPAVSVVVICFNDAANLGTAVRSALAQTMSDVEVLIVDDASTDDTAAVAARLAAADSRVRVLRLPVNSGGCSRPRNEGLDQARGDYVTFLDSDDVLTRRACAAVLGAARRTGADMVCGRWIRRHHDPTRYLAMHSNLYRRAGYVDDVSRRPQQLYDTPAVAKLYRREFLLDRGLRFPEGLLYEDLLFTAEAYLSSSGIAFVPDLVYVWNVHKSAETPSITNRADLRTWRDRFEIHRRIDRFLDEQQVAPEVRLVKERKFLVADFLVFLRQLRQNAPAVRVELTALAADYLKSVDIDRVESRPALRVAAALASLGDTGRLVVAADYAVNGGVGSDLVVDEGRLRWTAAYLDVDALDVSDTRLLSVPFERTPFLCTVRQARWSAERVRLDGVVADVLGRLGSPDALRARLVVTGRLGGALVTSEVLLSPEPGGVAFTTELDLARLGRRLGRPTVGHELRLSLELRRGAEVTRRPLSARDADLPIGDQPLPTPWRGLVGDRARLAEVNGRLAVQLVALPRLTRAAVTGASWARYAARLAAGRLGRG